MALPAIEAHSQDVGQFDELPSLCGHSLIVIQRSSHILAFTVYSECVYTPVW